MSKAGDSATAPTAMVEIKSKFELEFRRISVPRFEAERLSLEAFYRLVTDAHCLPPAAHVRISYQDPRAMRLTDLERSSDLATALRGAAPLLRVFVSRLRGVEVEVSGDEDEVSGSGDNCRENGREGLGGGGGGEGGREGTDGGRGGSEEGGGWGRERGEGGGWGRERGEGGGQSRTGDHIFNSGTRNHWRGEALNANVLTTAEGEGHTQTRCSSTLQSPHDRCRLGDKENELPEHPLITFYKKQYRELGGSSKPSGEDNAGLERDQENKENVTDNMDKLSLSSNSTEKQVSRNHNLAKSEQDLSFVIEIYGFPSSVSTRDILQEFQEYKRSELCIKWVDSTHALGIFSTEKQACLACGTVFKRIRARLVREGTPDSIAMAERLGHDLRPQRSHSEERPKTTAMVARRMISSALGIRVRLSPEERQREMRELEEAREKRRLKN